MLKIQYEKRFKKDLKTIIKRGYNISILEKVIDMLSINQILPKQYKDHQLKGSLKEFRECHLQSDWLLIYQIDKENLILVLTRTGSHSDLFES